MLVVCKFYSRPLLESRIYINEVLNILLNLNLANTGCISDRTLHNIGSTDLHPQRVRFERDSGGRCTYLLRVTN